MPIPGPPITSASTVKFVDSIAASPTTRLALNDGDSFITLRDGTAFNPPPLNQPTSALPGVFDGAPPTASSYGNRVIDLKLRLKAVDEDGLANLIRALMVELNRNTNILMLQVGSTPLFFRTYRTSAEDIDIGDLGLSECTVTVPLLAEPFAYGLRVDAATVSVKCDATLANGLFLDVTGVVGDVDTPAYLKVDTGTSAITGPILATRRRGTPSSAPFARQAEAATTLGTDTALFADGVGATGAGSNTTQTTFATDATMVNRLTFSTLGGGADARGTYRVYARCRKTVAGDTITMRLARGGVQFATATLSAASTAYQIIDLGLIQVPFGDDSPTGYSGVQLAPTDIGWRVQVARTAGAGNCIIDEILWVPADAELLISGVYNVAAIPAIYDGPNDACYFLGAGGTTFGATDGTYFQRVGAIPNLTPGQTNRIYVIPGGFVPADSLNVTVSHWPRYLVV